MSDVTKILAVGTGAVGAFYAGKLSQAGAEVSVLCRSDYDVVKASGIAIKSYWGDFHFTPANVIKTAAESPEVDYIIVALKVLPEIDTIEIIRHAVTPRTVIVLIQNGIDIETQIQKAFPENEIISGLAFICCRREGPGQIVHQDVGRVKVGTWPKGITPAGQKLQQLFEAAGVPCELSDNVSKARWEKLVWNAPFNPISVLGGGVTTKDMLGPMTKYVEEEAPESARLCRRIMEEVVKISQAVGEPLAPEIVDRNISYTISMEAYKTSMCLDFENKRPLEVEAILGNPVRIARKHGIVVPHMESIYSLLQLVDSKLRVESNKY